MCRTGFSGPGSTHRITFKEAGGAKKAYALAEKWLAKEMIEYEGAVLGENVNVAIEKENSGLASGICMQKSYWFYHLCMKGYASRAR